MCSYIKENLFPYMEEHSNYIFSVSLENYPPGSMLCIFANIIQQSLVHDCVFLTNRKTSYLQQNSTSHSSSHCIFLKIECNSLISFTNIIVRCVTGVVPPLPGQSVHCQSDLWGGNRKIWVKRKKSLINLILIDKSHNSLHCRGISCQLSFSICTLCTNTHYAH